MTESSNALEFFQSITDTKLEKRIVELLNEDKESEEIIQQLISEIERGDFE